MHARLFVCFYALSLLVQATAFAQPAEPLPAGKTTEEVQTIKQRSAEWLTTCLADWDAQTHMTKTEWRATCERVSKEREQFLLNTPGALSVGTKAIR
jgi:hypothetical protein